MWKPSALFVGKSLLTCFVDLEADVMMKLKGKKKKKSKKESCCLGTLDRTERFNEVL